MHKNSLHVGKEKKKKKRPVWKNLLLYIISDKKNSVTLACYTNYFSAFFGNKIFLV